MLVLGFVLTGVGAAILLIGLFSDSGRFIGWHIGSHTGLILGAVAGAAIIAGIRLIRWGAVRGVKNAWAQRKLDKREKHARTD